jgi:hypothetical protein
MRYSEPQEYRCNTLTRLRCWVPRMCGEVSASDRFFKHLVCIACCLEPACKENNPYRQHHSAKYRATPPRFIDTTPFL